MEKGLASSDLLRKHDWWSVMNSMGKIYLNLMDEFQLPWSSQAFYDPFKDRVSGTSGKFREIDLVCKGQGKVREFCNCSGKSVQEPCMTLLKLKLRSSCKSNIAFLQILISSVMSRPNLRH